MGFGTVAVCQSGLCVLRGYILCTPMGQWLPVSLFLDSALIHHSTKGLMPKKTGGGPFPQCVLLEGIITLLAPVLELALQLRHQPCSYEIARG